MALRILLALFLLSGMALAETVWSEDFNTSADQGKGAYGSTITSPGSGKWSVNVDNCTLANNNDWFKVINNLFEARDVDGTQQTNGGGEGAVWTSEFIDISGYTNVTISIDISESGSHENKDFIKASYKIDSGSITQFGHIYDDFSAQSFSVDGLSGSSLTVYVEADNNGSTEYLRFDNVLVTGTASYTVNTPTSFTAGASSTSQINLSWTKNAADDDVIVVFDSDGSFTDPVDGTSYSGSALGGTVIYQGSAESYSHTSLSASTHYYYKAWSVDASDNYSSGVTDDATTNAPTTVDDPTFFSATTASALQINLSWTQNGDTDDVMVVFDSDGSFTDPSNGTSYSVSSSACGGTVIFNGSATSYNHTSLSSGTHYYYKVWSMDGSDNYSSGVTDDATTLKAEPTNHASSFTSTSTDTSITLNWNDNDGSATADGFIIKASSTSLSSISAPTDGSPEFDDSNLSDGSAIMNIDHESESYTFTGLDPESTYYFKIWPYSNTSSDIDYKTNGTVPSAIRSTTVVASYLINLNFENSGGYSTSIAEFTDGTSDYFLRTNGDDINSNVEFNNIQGSYYFTAQDIDGDGASIPASITIDGIDISSQGNLEFSIYIAEDDDGSQQDWDDPDYLHIDYDIDNSGIFTNLIHVEGSGGRNTEPKIDTNFDGTGNGTAITNTFTKFTASIPGTGSSLDIKITFNLGGAQEDIAIDNVQLSGVEIVENPSSLSATTNSESQIDLSWDKNANDDNVLIVYDTDSTFSDPLNGSTYSVSSSACGGTVIYSGSGTSFDHTGLDPNTDYYYKIWSFDNSTEYSTGVGIRGITDNVEPSNHVSSFTGTSTYKSLTLTWNDNDGSNSANGFLIKVSTSSLSAIGDPTDGVPVSNVTDLSDGEGAMNISHGVQASTWTNMLPEQDYYFKIWPYGNSGSNIKYKTDGSVPSQSLTTANPPKIIISEILQNPSDVTDLKGEWFEIYNADKTNININGWSISDNGSNSHTINNGGDLYIQPGKSLVLGINSLQSTNGNYECDYQYSSFRLDNAADEIIIKDGTITIDSIAYDGGPNWPDPNGASMVFVGTAADDNNDYSKWETATERESGFVGTDGDKGSPGISRLIIGILNIKVFLQGAF